jgi:phosphatidylserine/phosphatidylglycerophosphate/cardiolipin synthase-like enzyme
MRQLGCRHAYSTSLLCSGRSGGHARRPCRKSKSIVDQAVEAYQATNSTTLPAAGTIEVAFSPNEGSEHLVVKVIDSAKTELDLLSYSFTSVPIVEALVRARHRGVVVRLVADEKNNVSADRSGKSRAALGALVNAGADVRTIRVYPIHHDNRNLG